MSDSVHQPFDAALTAVPEPLRHQVSARWHELAPSLATLQLQPEKWLETLPRVFAASDFVARSCVQQAALLQDLIVSGDLSRCYPSGELAQFFQRGNKMAEISENHVRVPL